VAVKGPGGGRRAKSSDQGRTSVEICKQRGLKKGASEYFCTAGPNHTQFYPENEQNSLPARFDRRNMQTARLQKVEQVSTFVRARRTAGRRRGESTRPRARRRVNAPMSPGPIPANIALRSWFRFRNRQFGYAAAISVFLSPCCS